MAALATSAQAFEGYPDIPERRGYEYLDGTWVKIPMGNRSVQIALTIYRLLHKFVTEQGVGVVLGHETSFQIWPDHPFRYRKPDGAFVRRGGLPGNEIPDSHIHTVPDLVIEVTSRHDVARLIEEKVQEYVSAGVASIWVVYPETQTIHVRHADGTARVLGSDDRLTDEAVLPGFAVPVREVFA